MVAGKRTHDGNTKVSWVPTIAAKSAPTVAEIGAGTDLTPQTTSDGVNATDARNKASVSLIDESFVAEAVGTHGSALTLKFVRLAAAGVTDDVWDLFVGNHGQAGFIVIGRDGSVGTAADEVEVYPVEAFEPTPLPSAANEYQMFEVEFAVTDKPDRAAVVAA